MPLGVVHVTYRSAGVVGQLVLHIEPNIILQGRSWRPGVVRVEEENYLAKQIEYAINEGGVIEGEIEDENLIWRVENPAVLRDCRVID